ncbi:glycosyltransferase family 1 protein [Mucor lusitanicus]|uniref:UDP-N-acetylglucosamine transferase subunit ALG13 n=2 Tax=Mucor circinelloides f. lusitanicus TaxID=29924 RepID=A0A168JNT4_MUCCL|nr:glycosyltransferase family 1 protein [Mucor lusitanicus]OAD01423.1 glycosyltransferase family 1 protein [Mucor lusitanicus CBS 277.49]
MFLFVTVGSTGFDALIQQTTSSDFLNSLSEVGIKKVVYQFGASEQVFANSLQFYQGKVLDLDGYKYKASIAEDMEQADIIISHAGAGTILQALRMENKKLIVVVNESLMDNHQHQLAQAMHSSNYAICSDISELTNTLKNINHIQLTPFPAAKPETFASIVDEQMGFAL